MAVENEARLLRDAGHELIQYTLRNPEDSINAAMSLSLSAWNPLAARKIATLVSRHRPDITHVHNTWFQLSTSIFAAIRSAGSPLAVTLHNYRSVCANAFLLREGKPCTLCPDGKSALPAIQHRCYRNSTLLSTAAAAAITAGQARNVWQSAPNLLIAVSAFVQDKLIQGGLPAESMIVKHHFVADPGPRGTPPSRSNAVLYVGRLSPEKGIEQLLKAWARADRGELVLELIGEEIPNAPRRSGLGSDIRFLGKLRPEELQEKMLSARALVMPSLSYESFGMVLIEAMASGLPVMASRIGAIPEVLGSWPSELLVEPNSVTALSAALDLLSEGTLLDRAGEDARKRYESAFTPVIGLTALESAYAQAIAVHG